MMRWIGLACLMLVVMQENVAGGDAALANGARAVWDLDKAHREKTPTREQICINGLWRWQPARNAKGLATLSNPLENDTAVPADRWGYFKVPGCWPGAADYQQKDSQSILPDQSWSSENLRGLSTAWYQREITIPQDWTGRRISLSVETLNSLATIYIDGKLAGDGKNANIYFPGGELDITASCKPGQKHVLTALVFALPMGGVRYSYADSAAPKLIDTKATPLLRRGFCGDVFLVGTPSGARVADVKIGTSWRNGEITVDAALQGLDSTGQYTLRAVVSDGGRTVKEISSRKFAAADLVDGRFAVVEKWKAEKLWDTHTPQNMYHLQLTLQDAGGKALDVALPVRFGYREMWIEGRDFYLNGSRIFLSGIAMANSQVGAAAATYETTRETIARMQAYGINFVYTGPFNCSPGAHLSYGEILRAADDAGLLIAFTQPHMGGYEVDWAKPAEQDAQSDYARHAAAYVRTAQNHPSVVCYSMNHNAGGYAEDMCPSKIDGKYQRAGSRSPDKLLRAEAIVKRLDSTRIIYHHAGGNLGTMHTSNFYPNFTPIQELSDWFQHWSAEGVKPLYTNEYGGPFGWDWTMYRGWYKDKRTFGSAVVPWEFCIAEWNSQFLGDRAFQISENEKSILRWEAKQCADKAKLEKGWYRWDYPVVPGSSKLAETNFVTAMYFTDNFRAYRTLGVSAISPWEFHRFWDLRDNANREQKNFQVDWDNLQRPGFSPDFVKDRYENYVFAYERADWVPSAAAEALKRNNMPLLAYIGGKTAQVTSKDHNFVPGEAVEKQLIVINNSRTTVSAECSWSLALPQALSGVKAVSVKTGEQERIPLRFDLPASVAAGSYALTATVRFGSGETQTDTFTIHVVPAPQPAKSGGKIALFDPKGETTAWLKTEGIACQNVAATADLAPFDTLIIGKAALTVNGPGPDVSRVRDGLKVILFEQTTEVLERRFGFRVVEYGLRNAYPRVPDHPLLAGITVDNLRDWRGEATILPPTQPKLEGSPKFNGAPATKWCDIPVSQIWRCGCRGNVSSVLIEKPACGDFLPVIDGGFSLQYSPLMEYREGKGMVIFCQMDVTGRTESDPAASALTRNILQYASAWKAAPARKTLYAGDANGRNHLLKAGFTVTEYNGEALSANHVLAVGPGGGKKLASHAPALAAWLKAGGKLLALALDEAEANAFLPGKVDMKKAEHIAAYFEAPALASGFAGVNSSDVHCHSPRELPLVTGGATVVANGVLAKSTDANVVFCQMAPWQFPYTCPQYLKRTFRRTSCLVTRLLANMNADCSTPILERFKNPNTAAEQRWLTGLYLDQPEEWDNPYRFFRW